MSPQADGDQVSIVVDGETVIANPGELLIDACERTGTYIPRFCHRTRSIQHWAEIHGSAEHRGALCPYPLADDKFSLKTIIGV
mgnify:CR=1 FL=1